MNPKKWEIWDAYVHFEDTGEVKRRPVLVYSNTAYAIISYKITGTNRGDDIVEFRIEKWKEAGLSKPSSIRIEKVLRLNIDKFIEKRGILHENDRFRFEFRIASRK